MHSRQGVVSPTCRSHSHLPIRSRPVPQPGFRLRSSTPTTQASTARSKLPSMLDLEAKMEFLKEDLSHLFDEKGIDPTAYAEVVDFRDPITKYTTLGGYLFNIKMLKKVFNPSFQLHAICPAGPTAIATRWTMVMDFTPAKALPTAKWWSPQLIFTGTSTYVFQPKTGKICTHIDRWDSIENQEYFSLEAFQDFLGQVGSLQSIPKGLEQPEFTTLRRTRQYNVRRYSPFLVVQSPLDSALQSCSNEQQQGKGAELSFNPAGPGRAAFGNLVKFITGSNERQERMPMTTPVLTTSKGTMQFVIGPSSHQSLNTVPSPLKGSNVETRKSGGLWAVRTFGGEATEESTEREVLALRAALEQDRIAVDLDQGYQLARYNGPGTPAFLRRNEVMVPLVPSFDVWKEGEVSLLASIAQT